MTEFRFERLALLLAEHKEIEAREYLKACAGFTFDTNSRLYHVEGITWRGTKINLGTFHDYRQAIDRYNEWMLYHFGGWSLINISPIVEVD